MISRRATTPSSVSLLFHSELKRLQSEVGSLQEQNALLEKQRDLYRLHLLQRGDLLNIALRRRTGSIVKNVVFGLKCLHGSPPEL